MPNQMIALQARNPQIADPAAQTAKYVNMMNMAKQQEAAQRQAALAQQTMDINQQENVRAGETQASNMRKADLDYQITNMKRLRNLGVVVMQTEDPTAREAAYQSLVGMIGDADEQFGATLRQVAPTFNAQVLQALIMEADKFTDKTVPNVEASKEYAAAGARDAQGNPIPEGTVIDTRVGGLPGAAGSTPLRASGANTPAPRTPVPTATPEQAPQMSPDGGQLDDFQKDHIRRMKEGLGMTDTPASFTRGGMGAATATQMTPERAQQIVDSAVRTRVMAQEDFDQLMALAPEQNKQPFMEMIRANNITLQPGGMGQQPQFGANPVQTPQSTYADLGSQPMMRNTEAQYIPVQRRDPNMGAYPGSAQVPISRVSAEARAGRPSKQEMYDAEAAKIKAARDAGPAPVTAQQKIARKTEVAQAYSKAQTLIDKAYNPKEGIISIANKIKMLSDDQKEAITGYSNYIPSFRGTTREADTLFGNLKGVVTSLGKDAAAASGAVGNMAVQEWKIAADMIANLDLANMTPRALDAQMDRIIEQVSNATKLAERVYNIQYGDDVKELPAFKLRGAPPARTKTPVAKGGTRLSPDIDQILKSRGI